MAVVGGNTVYPGTPYGGLNYFGDSPDPFEHGIGIWDLSLMQWRDNYDPDAEAYVTPDVVKTRNDQSPYPSQWTEPIIETWFGKKGKRIIVYAP